MDFFRIDAIGCNTRHPNGIYLDRKNGMKTHLFLCIKSKCRLLINDSFINIEEPTFILYDKNVRQCYTSNNEPYVDDWIHFDLNDSQNFFNSINIPFNTPMTIMSFREISQMISDLYIESLQEGPHHTEIMDLKLKTLFYKFSDIYNIESTFSEKLNRYRLNFISIRNQIYNPGAIDEKLSVSDIAAKLNLSVSYFQHIYKQLFGVSVMQDIIKSRINYACHLLQSNSDSITDIAFQCKYENKEHFTRQFKSVMGVTPKQFRNAKQGTCDKLL